MKCDVCGKEVKGRLRETPLGFESALRMLGIKGTKAHRSCIAKVRKKRARKEKA